MIVCTIHGPPGPAKANTRTTPVRRRKFVSMITTTPYRKWQAHATAEIAKAAKGVTLSGALWITVSAYWPKTMVEKVGYRHITPSKRLKCQACASAEAKP
jgi:Holliday junction resolvase RusA-like endonuclease